MQPTESRAYLVDRDQAGSVRGRMASIPLAQWPPGEVLIRAEWSSINYKDALAATGHPGVARRLPHVPGIDVAGRIVALESEASEESLRLGDEVIVTGYELGAGRWGGWSEYVRVPRGWVVPCPPSLTAREAMALGTAGFTAAQCVRSLQHHRIQPSDGEIVVTGATGGVGCIAVRILSQLGYQVTAVTGKPALQDRLRRWGAREVLGRDAVLDSSGKPLLPGRWSGAVDTVGGATLATLLRQTKDHGCVTACGLVGGVDLPVSVYPFILRGVTLAGITSSGCQPEERREIWRLLGGAWRVAGLEEWTNELPLDRVDEAIPRLLAGEIVGRTVVSIHPA